MSIRSIIIYICVLFIVRLMGKRQIGEMQPFEFVITLIIADLACIPMAELSVPLIHGLVPICSLLILHFLLCFLARKFMIVRYLLSGKPAVVITPKGIDYKILKSLNMTLDDLMELVRGCNVFNIADISYAILETNGKLCVMLKSDAEPATREDLKLKTSKNCLPINIIMDGKLIKDNVKMMNLTDEFIEKTIKKANIKNINDVLLFTIDNNGFVFLQEKFGDKYYTFNSNYGGK